MALAFLSTGGVQRLACPPAAEGALTPSPFINGPAFTASRDGNPGAAVVGRSSWRRPALLTA
jgi:hypothetical protein